MEKGTKSPQKKKEKGKAQMWGLGDLSQLCIICKTKASRGGVSKLVGDLAELRVAGQQAMCEACAQARLRCCK